LGLYLQLHRSHVNAQTVTIATLNKVQELDEKVEKLSRMSLVIFHYLDHCKARIRIGGR
jgi:hypothetical protein